jgi:metallophosphoesterase (TIGR00282 family)
MNILYVGDVMGEVGLQVVEKVVPKLRKAEKIDLVVAQAENVTDGKGVSPVDFKRLLKAGVDFCTGGNWSLYREEIVPLMNDATQPIIRPANYPEGTKGLGYKYAETAQGKVLIVSLLGKIVGRDADKEINNPLLVIDEILARENRNNRLAAIVNFHGDYSSEKVVIGHYLDGRVTAVIGDHWHVPTADARVLPGGTAHQTDVGMCGTLDSSLGVTYESIIPRWHDNKQTRNTLATAGPRQFNALLIESDDKTGLTQSAKAIQQIIEHKS